MPNEIAMRREGNHLVPVDPMSAEMLAEVPTTKDVLVTVKVPRNLRQFRLAWALAQKVHEACDWLPDREAAMDWLKIKARHVRMIHDPLRDKTAIIPKSIAFASLDQAGFKRVLDRMMWVTVNEIIPGLDESALRAELEAMVGIDNEPEPVAKPKRTSKPRAPKTAPEPPQADPEGVPTVPHVPSVDEAAEQEMLDRAGINEESEVVEHGEPVAETADPAPADRPGPPQTATEYMDRTRDWICKHTDPRGHAAAREIFSGEIHRDMRVAVRLSVAHRKLLEKEMDEHFEGLKAGAGAKKS